MKKLIVFPLLACLASLGGTTAFLVKTHKPEPVAADSLAPRHDSTSTDSVKHVTARKDSAATDTAHVAARPDTSGKRAGTAEAAPTPLASGPATPQVPPPLRTVAQVDPAARAAAYKQVARVLSAMKPVEAAKVLAFLSDDEVEGLLRAVGPRQAADFLTNIPKERAAGLSRRLLVPKEQGR
jgi:hypothetical protein